MQPCVLERNDRLAGQRRGGHSLLGVEIGAEEKQAAEAAAANRQLELEPLPTRYDVADLDDRAVLGDHEAAVRLRRFHGGLDDHAPELLGVERGRERVSEAGVRLTETPALALEILQPGLQLCRHVVERPSESRELVVPPDGHALVQTPGRDRVRGRYERVEAADDRAAGQVGDEGDQQQRSEQADQQPADHRALLVGDPALGVSAASTTPCSGTRRAAITR